MRSSVIVSSIVVGDRRRPGRAAGFGQPGQRVDAGRGAKAEAKAAVLSKISLLVNGHLSFIPRIRLFCRDLALTSTTAQFRRH
jgi:hypothetical protein